MSFLARTPTPADGSQTAFPVSFPLPPAVGRDGVAVYVYDEGSTEPGDALTVDTDYVWTSDGIVTLAEAPPPGKVVEPRRETPVGDLDNTMQPGGSMRASELVQNDTQLLYALQEVTDKTVDLHEHDAALDERVAAVEAFEAGIAAEAVAPQAVYANTRGVIAALGSTIAPVVLTEKDKEGTWFFRDGEDLSAEVATDTEQGVFIAPAAATGKPVDGSGGAWMRHPGISTWLNAKWFASFGSSMPTHAQLNVAAAVASLLSLALYLPAHADPYMTYSDAVHGTGITVPAPANGNPVRIVGDGAGTIIKRAPVAAGEMNNASRVLRVEAVEGLDYYYENLTVDGSEQDVPYDPTPANLYQFEQCHNIMWYAGAGGSGVTLGTIYTKNVRCINAVGDGLSHNFPYVNAFHDNYIETGRVRRTRSGMQLGIFSGVTHIKGGYMSFLESEPVADMPLGHKLIVEGVTCTENIDLSGRSATSRLNVELIGVKTLMLNPLHPAQRFSLAYLEGEATGCEFMGTDMVYGRSQMYRNKMHFWGGRFIVPVNPTDPTMAIPIMEFKDDDSFHIYHGVGFYGPAGITSTANYAPPSGAVVNTNLTGAYFMPANFSTTGLGLTAFHDCYSDESLPYFYHAYRCGTVIFDGGKPRGKTAVVRYANVTGTVSNIVITRPERFPKAGLGKLIAFAASTGTGTITGSGTLDGELMGLTPDGTSPAGVTFNLDLIIQVDSTPAGRLRGLPGTRARLRSPVAGATDEWVHRNGATIGATAGWETTPKKALAAAVTYATPATTYAAPAGGATIDTEARASLAQLATDVAAIKTALGAENVDLVALKTVLQAASLLT